MRNIFQGIPMTWLRLPLGGKCVWLSFQQFSHTCLLLMYRASVLFAYEFLSYVSFYTGCWFCFLFGSRLSFCPNNKKVVYGESSSSSSSLILYLILLRILCSCAIVYWSLTTVQCKELIIELLSHTLHILRSSHVYLGGWMDC